MDIYSLIEKHKWSKDKPSPRNKITTVEFFKLCVELRQVQKVAEHLGISRDTVARWLKGYGELAKGKMLPGNRITGYFEHKQCSTCEKILPFECYSSRDDRSFNLESDCRSCIRKMTDNWAKNNPEKEAERSRRWKKNNPEKVRADVAKRRAAKLQRTPAWANQEKIQEIYSNCPEGYHVDHIVPLQGELVSGLHVENNLQYLPASENSSKGNKFQVG